MRRAPTTTIADALGKESACRLIRTLRLRRVRLALNRAALAVGERDPELMRTVAAAAKDLGELIVENAVPMTPKQSPRS